MQIKNKMYLLSNKKINFNSIISNVSKLCICIYFRLFRTLKSIQNISICQVAKFVYTDINMFFIRNYQ